MGFKQITRLKIDRAIGRTFDLIFKMSSENLVKVINCVFEQRETIHDISQLFDQQNDGRQFVRSPRHITYFKDVQGVIYMCDNIASWDELTVDDLVIIRQPSGRYIRHPYTINKITPRCIYARPRLNVGDTRRFSKQQHPFDSPLTIKLIPLN